jgi:hypothetical protein
MRCYFLFSSLAVSILNFMFRVTKSLFMSFHYIKGKAGVWLSEEKKKAKLPKETRQ